MKAQLRASKDRGTTIGLASGVGPRHIKIFIHQPHLHLQRHRRLLSQVQVFRKDRQYADAFDDTKMVRCLTGHGTTWGSRKTDRPSARTACARVPGA